MTEEFVQDAPRPGEGVGEYRMRIRGEWDTFHRARIWRWSKWPAVIGTILTIVGAGGLYIDGAEQADPYLIGVTVVGVFTALVGYTAPSYRPDPYFSGSVLNH